MPPYRGQKIAFRIKEKIELELNIKLVWRGNRTYRENKLIMCSKNVEAIQNIPTINIPYEPHGVMLACEMSNVAKTSKKVSDYWVELNYTEEHSKEDDKKSERGVIECWFSQKPRGIKKI